MDVATVVTSAAFGGVDAAAINVVGQTLERRSRRKELLLAKAVELARERVRFAFEVAKASGQMPPWPIQVSLALATRNGSDIFSITVSFRQTPCIRSEGRGWPDAA